MEKENAVKKVMSAIKNETGHCAFLSLTGNGEILISGCMGIEEYGEKEIRAYTESGVISICGKGLRLSVFRGDILSIEGTISVIKIGQ